MRYFVLALLVACPVWATEYHVSVDGNDSYKGSISKPLKTIQAAANAAQPGDVITVHAGVYRERVSPPRGGTSDDRRITYQAAQGEEVVIKGSEVVSGWKEVQKGVWKLTLPDTFFGEYNPYEDVISGDWFKAGGRVHHTGEVFLEGEALFEETSLGKVVATERTWCCDRGNGKTYIWANFGGSSPRGKVVEINVRPACFYPESPGRDFITVRGFTMQQAATQWAPPTAEQIGLIGTHWSKGWVIENNVISDSTCTGITLGKDSTAADAIAASAEGYNKVIEEALRKGWSKEKIGSHIVRNNTIYDCGQAGICGSMGGAFSRLTGNHIYNINTDEPFGGAEIAGIKLHGAIDTTIKNNWIHNAAKGIWLDWMSQGTRVSANLCYDNRSKDLHSEVNHGPYMVDNNLFLSQIAFKDWSQGGAFVHNLIAGDIVCAGPGRRQTPFHEEHSTTLGGLSKRSGGDNRFYNNIFIGGPGLRVYDKAKLPLQAEGNVYLDGAAPHKAESDSLHLPQFEGNLTLIDKKGIVHLHLNLPRAMSNQRQRLVTTELLGKARISGARYENADGTPLQIERDYFGVKRNRENPSPGPFENPGTGDLRLKIWPKKR